MPTMQKKKKAPARKLPKETPSTTRKLPRFLHFFVWHYFDKETLRKKRNEAKRFGGVWRFFLLSLMVYAIWAGTMIATLSPYAQQDLWPLAQTYSQSIIDQLPNDIQLTFHRDGTLTSNLQQPLEINVGNESSPIMMLIDTNNDGFSSQNNPITIGKNGIDIYQAPDGKHNYIAYTKFVSEMEESDLVALENTPITKSVIASTASQWVAFVQDNQQKIKSIWRILAISFAIIGAFFVSLRMSIIYILFNLIVSFITRLALLIMGKKQAWEKIFTMACYMGIVLFFIKYLLPSSFTMVYIILMVCVSIVFINTLTKKK